MQTPKKRKRETVEVMQPRIMYDAPNRTFDRLFNEDSLEEMKDVVRKKLNVATSVPIYLSQLRDGRSIDLEDDDDFDAFWTFAHASQSAHIKVVVGRDTPMDSEFSSVKKKKKKSNAIVSSSIMSSSALVDSLPQKKRRVSFVDQLSQSAIDVPSTPDKKKGKPVANSSAPLEDISLTKSVTNEGREKKKAKKTLAAVGEELILTRTENGAGGTETIPETPSTKKTKKRTREEDTSQVLSLFQPDALADGDPLRPAKKSRNKRKETDDKLTPPKDSTSKSVLPPETLTLSPAVPSVEPEAPIKSKKGREGNVSEPHSIPAPSSPEQARDDEASNERKGKGKSEVKADVNFSVDPSTTTRVRAAGVKRNKVNLAHQKEVPSSVSAIPDQTTKKKGKAAESLQATLSAPRDITRKQDHDLEGPPSAPAETRTRRKSQDAESSKLGTVQEQPLDWNNSREYSKAAVAAIQALLEKRGISTSASPQVPQAASLQPTLQIAASELPAQEEEPCPLCDESPTHDRPLCPVIKGGVRTMRRRLARLEKDSSGDETKQEKRQQVIAELQVMIQKRARKPKTSSAATNGAITAKKAAVTQKQGPPPATPSPIAEVTKSAKQVEVVSPPSRVVDIVPPLAPSQPVASTLSTSESLKSAKQPSSLQPSQQLASSQKSVAKTAQDKVTKEKLMANLPLVSEPSLDGLVDLPFNDLSQVTDNDLQGIIYGRRVSIADVPSSDEDAQEKDEEEPSLDEDEPHQQTSRRLSQGFLREYPSSSDAEGEEDDSPEGSVSKHKTTSLSTEEEDPTDDRQVSEDPLPRGDGNASFREVDNRGSSREIDKTGDDAIEAALAEDFASLNAAINGKQKGAEVDSDTAVGSQVEEIVDLQAKEKRVETTTATTDPIEPSKEPPDEQAELIVSDDDHPAAQSTPNVESIIRTRSQRKKDMEQQEAPKTVKKARKITELPIPSLPSVRARRSPSSSITGARRVTTTVQQDPEGKRSDDDVDVQPPRPSAAGKLGPKAPVKDTKRSTNTRSKTAVSETSKGKASTRAGSRVSVANGTVSKPKSLYKITPTEPIGGLVEAINRASGGNNNIIGSQWAVLQESNPLTETPGQVDELHSDFTSQVDQTPLIVKKSQDREPLFLPSETQQSYPYSQFSEIFATPRGDDAHEPSHESDDENEVLASVVKPTHTYRGLSQIAGSQTFKTPQFQQVNLGKTKEPESLYGRNRPDVVSETDSSSESDEDRPVVSHIPASRRAGGLPILRK